MKTIRLFLLFLISVSPAFGQAIPAQFSSLLTNSTAYNSTWTTWYTAGATGTPGTYNGPAYGGSQVDPIYGTTSNRPPFIGDCGAPGFNGCAYNGLISDYSKVVLWSADAKYFIIAEPAGWLHLYDATTTPYTWLRRIQINPGTNAEGANGADLYGDDSNWSWSRTPGTHLLYYTGFTGSNRNSLKYYDPVADTSTLVYNFQSVMNSYPGCAGINNEREGEFSDNDNVFAFTCNSGDTAAIVYKKSTNTVVSKPFSGTGNLCTYSSAGLCVASGANYITVSPSGTYILINWDAGDHDYDWYPGEGTEVFDANLNYLGGATSNNNHGDVGYDVAGNEVFVQSADEYATNYQYHMFAVAKLSAVTNNGVVGSTAIGGAQHFFRMPSTYGYYTGFTISMRATQGSGMGYMLLSNYDSADNAQGTTPFSLENDALKIDWANLSADNTSDQVAGSPNTYYRLGRTHSLDAANSNSYQDGDYFAQPDGAPDNTFSKFSFSTTMDHINLSASSNFTTDAELPTPQQGRYAVMYTILNANPTVATPIFSPAAGTYPSAQTVTISDATSGATIYYTTNGTTPTTASSVYSTPISVITSETVKALAAKSGYTNSAVGSAAYTINSTVATPTFSPAAGTYPSAQTVTISDATSSATIHYTTNGTTPTTSSPVYSTPISVATSETVKALAAKSGYTNSAVGSAAYTINSTVATPTFSPAAGIYPSAQTVTISDATSGATIYYTTNGTTPTTASSVYSTPISVATSETVKALAAKSGYTNSIVGSAVYTISTGTVVTVNDTIVGTGNNQFNYQGNWSYGSQSGAYDNDNHWSSTVNSYYTFQFSGQQAVVYGSLDSNGGIAAYSVDGGAETNFDDYAASRVDNVFLFSTPILSSGTHTLKVRVTGLKNAASTNYALSADRVDVYSSLTAVTVNDTIVGTGNNQFNYQGNWSYGSQSGAYDNDNHWSSTVNSYYTFQFSGQQAVVYGSLDSNGGIAAYSVDGGAETNFDDYAASRVDNVFLFSTPILSSGTHTLKVRVTGLKNAASTNYALSADRVDVYSSLTAVTVNDTIVGTGNNQFNYQGNWSYGSQSGAYDNDNHWSSTVNSYYTFQFSGQQAVVYGSLDSNGGIAAYSVDGGAETNFDDYAASRVDNVFLFSTPVLSSGTHTLKVRVTGLKNAASTNYALSADRIDVY